MYLHKMGFDKIGAKNSFAKKIIKKILMFDRKPKKIQDIIPRSDPLPAHLSVGKKRPDFRLFDKYKKPGWLRDKHKKPGWLRDKHRKAGKLWD